MLNSKRFWLGVKTFEVVKGLRVKGGEKICYGKNGMVAEVGIGRMWNCGCRGLGDTPGISGVWF